jgi:hypothetical protein
VTYQKQDACYDATSAQRIRRMKYWEIIADNLSKAGWSWGCVSTIDSNRGTIWIADAQRGDGDRFVVRADDSKRLWRNDNYLGILKTDLLNDCGEPGIKRGLTQPVFMN